MRRNLGGRVFADNDILSAGTASAPRGNLRLYSHHLIEDLPPTTSRSGARGCHDRSLQQFPWIQRDDRTVVHRDYWKKAVPGGEPLATAGSIFFRQAGIGRMCDALRYTLPPNGGPAWCQTRNLRWVLAFRGGKNDSDFIFRTVLLEHRASAGKYGGRRDTLVRPTCRDLDFTPTTCWRSCVSGTRDREAIVLLDGAGGIQRVSRPPCGTRITELEQGAGGCLSA